MHKELVEQLKSLSLILIRIAGIVSSYYLYQDGYWCFAMVLIICQIGLSSKQRSIKQNSMFAIRIYLMISYISRGEYSLYFVSAQLVYVHQYMLLFDGKKHDLFLTFRQFCQQSITQFQSILFLYTDYKFLLLVWLAVVYSVFEKQIKKIEKAMLNVRENTIFEGWYFYCLQPFFILNMFDGTFSFIIQDIITPNDLFDYYLYNFENFFGTFLMVVIYILNNIYFSSTENSCLLARIYFTILLVISLIKIQQKIKILRDFIKNGSFIDIWSVNSNIIQNIYNYEEELTINKRFVILKFLNQPNEQNVQINEEYWQNVTKLLVKTNKSFIISFFDVKYEHFHQLKSMIIFVNLEKKEIFINFQKKQEELNKTFLDLYYRNQFSQCKIESIQLNYYQDYLLPFLLENKTLLIDISTNSFESTYDKKNFLELKHSFTCPILSYYLLRKHTINYPFYIGIQTLFYDLYD
ncbi:hypothetical protein ABPG74_009234 [Tetrahymena malaccensis]